MANHSGAFSWKFPWTMDPGELQPLGLQKVRHILPTKHLDHVHINSTKSTLEKSTLRARSSTPLQQLLIFHLCNVFVYVLSLKFRIQEHPNLACVPMRFPVVLLLLPGNIWKQEGHIDLFTLSCHIFSGHKKDRNKRMNQFKSTSFFLSNK